MVLQANYCRKGSCLKGERHFIMDEDLPVGTLNGWEMHV